jgi:hypothetical protein
MIIEVGKIYRAKNPANAHGFYNDRQVLWCDENKVQYDSPAVAIGRRQPIVDREKFEKWAGQDVTGMLPGNEWQEYGSAR